MLDAFSAHLLYYFCYFFTVLMLRCLLLEVFGVLLNLVSRRLKRCLSVQLFVNSS